jgi:hypothetical protein
MLRRGCCAIGSRLSGTSLASLPRRVLPFRGAAPRPLYTDKYVSVDVYVRTAQYKRFVSEALFKIAHFVLSGADVKT